MTTHNLIPITPTESHLSADQIYRYLEGNLPPDKMHETENHMLSCTLCREAMDGLSLIPEQVAQPFIFDINRQVYKSYTRRKKSNTISHIKNWGLTTAILFLLIFAATIVWYEARQNATTNVAKSTKTESVATPEIGNKAYNQYIQDNLRYPVQAKQLNLAGEVVLSFSVLPDGSLSPIKVIKSLGEPFDNEAIRLIKEGPKWQPAYQNGKAISHTKVIRIPFKPNIN